MILDAQQLFSDSQALVATAVSTNVIDLGADRDIGIGTPMAVMVVVKVAQAGGGNFTIDLQTDDNVGFASPAVIASSGVLVTQAAGTKIILMVQPNKLVERFLRLNYTLSAGTITVTAELTPADFIQNENVFNDAINIG